MRISDWSSDVCSSDLALARKHLFVLGMDVGGRQAGNGDQQRGSSAQQGLHPEQLLCGACGSGAKSPIVAGAGKPGNRQAVVTVGGPETYEIGRAAGRERGGKDE